MKISYSIAKGRASSHCITWTEGKKRKRKFFKSLVDALLFKHTKEAELGVIEKSEINNEIIFHFLAEFNQKLRLMSNKLEDLEESVKESRELLLEMRKPPAPKILRIQEAAKVLRVSPRKLYYLLNKGVFKRYKLPHTRTTFIKLEEVEKALGEKNLDGLIK